VHTEDAAALLAELGNATRLEIVRLLVRAGPSGLPVGAIQRALGIPGSTLSHHLGHLRRVGLVRQERAGAVLNCFVDYRRLDAVVSFLTAECCRGAGVDDARQRRSA